MDDTYLAQLIAVSSHVNLKTIFLRCENRNRATQQYSASGWSWMNLRLCKAFEGEKISSVFSSFPDLPNASSVGSLNHATLPICVIAAWASHTMQASNNLIHSPLESARTSMTTCCGKCGHLLEGGAAACVATSSCSAWLKLCRTTALVFCTRARWKTEKG